MEEGEGTVLASLILATHFSSLVFSPQSLLKNASLLSFMHYKAVKDGDGLSSSSMNNGREKATPFSVVEH